MRREEAEGQVRLRETGREVTRLSLTDPARFIRLPFVRANMVEITQSKEDYIKAIWELTQDEEGAQRVRIAELLGVSAPSVTAALHRLEREGFARSDANGRVSLTEVGRHIAEKVVLRHNLVEKLLVEVIRIDWFDAHEEAERIEHVISEKVEQKLLELFGEDAHCPHGAPLREESVAERRKRGLRLLSECAPGEQVRIEIIFERDREFLRYLDEKRVLPGAQVQVAEKGYDGVITLSVDGRAVPLSGPASGRIWVRKITV